MEDVVTYAQNREDLYIASFFSDVERGFYVDVGAHDPVKDSVTKFFSLRGWTGINIEPQSEYYTLLTADRPSDVNLQIGVSDAPGSLQLRSFPGGGLSTFSDEMKLEYERDEFMRSVGHLDYSVEVDTLANILKAHVPDGQAIHFLKVDVEGLEYQVLRGNDWSRFRPILLCVEAIHIVQDWHQILADADYDKVFFDGVNEYFLAREQSARAERHDFAPMFLANKQIAPFYLSSRVEDLRSQLNHLQATGAELSAKNAEQADVIERMTAEHVDAVERTTAENASLREALNRAEQSVAELVARNMSIKFHARSLYQLIRKRLAARLDRHGGGPHQSKASQEGM
ncbi:FkbM family methyltransferase [Catellatospora citrea]|uniref:FkbM family methyltransferase n=1 Tax=Catellatospora citrea TaxID=53366 RepID=UPI0033D01128